MYQDYITDQLYMYYCNKYTINSCLVECVRMRSVPLGHGSQSREEEMCYYDRSFLVNVMIFELYIFNWIVASTQ